MQWIQTSERLHLINSHPEIVRLFGTRVSFWHIVWLRAPVLQYVDMNLARVCWFGFPGWVLFDEVSFGGNMFNLIQQVMMHRFNLNFSWLTTLLTEKQQCSGLGDVFAKFLLDGQ